ncbi:hypothetical protein, partial [Vibrio harveyi]|uniref:hypothetical protein n=1 Tax=Vibrio harveyi TaxID=669 RepID=UPI0033963AA9
SQRIKEIRRATPFDLSMIECLWFEIGQDAYDLKQAAHERGINLGYSGFDGATEWFEHDAELVEFVRGAANV